MKRILLVFCLYNLLFVVLPVNADFGPLKDYGPTIKQGRAFRDSAGYGLTTGQNTIKTLISQAIQVFLGVLGIVFLLLIVLAGYRWFMAEGNEDKTKEAKDTIKRAIIGLLIVVSAYAITYFVFANLPYGVDTAADTSINGSSGPASWITPSRG